MSGKYKVELVDIDGNIIYARTVERASDSLRAMAVGVSRMKRNKGFDTMFDKCAVRVTATFL